MQKMEGISSLHGPLRAPLCLTLGPSGRFFSLPLGALWELSFSLPVGAVWGLSLACPLGLDGSSLYPALWGPLGAPFTLPFGAQWKLPLPSLLGPSDRSL